jgi:predicted RNA binding protein YcfA (HicA-like mRNA interferase family)
VQQRGWPLARINGSHISSLWLAGRERIVIPIYGNQPLKTGLLRALMKIAGLTESDL